MGAISEIKEIGKFLRKMDNIDLYEKLMTVQEKTLETMVKNINLKKENDKLKEKLKLKGSIVFEKEVFWIKDESGNVKDGPFCPNCYDSEELTLHLITVEGDPTYKRCPKCHHVVKGL